MTEKEIVCRVAGRIVAIVVLDDDKEVDPMKNAVVYRKSLRYDKDQSGLRSGSQEWGRQIRWIREDRRCLRCLRLM